MWKSQGLEAQIVLVNMSKLRLNKMPLLKFNNLEICQDLELAAWEHT